MFARAPIAAILVLISMPALAATRQRVASHESACKAIITPRTVSMPAEGGSGTIIVSRTADCRWTPIPAADWVTVNTISISEGLITFTVGANPDLTPRTSTIDVAGAMVVVTQAARVLPNLLVNGSFERDLSGWAPTFSTGTGSATWNHLDASGSASSGSALIQSTQSRAGYQLLECINVEAGKLYEYGLKSRIASGQDPAGRVILGVYEYEVADCNKTGYFSYYAAEINPPRDTWTPYASTFTATSLTKSVYFVVAAGGHTQPPFSINIDDAFLRVKQ